MLYLSALLALVNVLFVLQGRTGPVVACVHILIFMARWLMQPKRGNIDRVGAGATVAVMVACAALAYHAFTSEDSHLADTGRKIASFRQNNSVTSAGVRLEFYRPSVALFIERPVAGYGVSSVLPEFERFAKNQTGSGAVTGNPHNKLLLMGVQLGSIGIALVLWLLFALRQESRRIDPLARAVVHGYRMAFCVGCLANSLLLNFTEGNLLILLSGISIYSCNTAPRWRTASSEAKSI